MTHVFIDTTVLCSRKTGKAFADVTRLARERKLQLHVSEVSRREYLSTQSAVCETFGRELKRLSIGNLYDSILGSLPSGVAIESNFEEWLGSVHAIVHPVKDHHGQKVVNAYFDGTSPFKTAKRREDFPDAFIWQAVLDLIDSEGSVYLISKDDGFKRPARTVPGITLHETLASFLAKSSLLDETADSGNLLAKIAANIPRIAERLSDPLTDALCDGQWDDVLGDYETVITGTGDPENLEVDVAHADDLGDGSFWIPFSADVECSVYYYLMGQTALDNVRKQASIEYVNRHYSGISDERRMHVEGFLVVEVDGQGFTVTVDQIDEIRPVDPTIL